MIVAFSCDECGDTSTSTADVWLIRGDSDRVAMRCPSCERLLVDDVSPSHFAQLMSVGVLIVGDAELELLREFEDPNPPTAC